MVARSLPELLEQIGYLTECIADAVGPRRRGANSGRGCVTGSSTPP